MIRDSLYIFHNDAALEFLVAVYVHNSHQAKCIRDIGKGSNLTTATLCGYTSDYNLFPFVK
jgi:hypothetical protein